MDRDQKVIVGFGIFLVALLIGGVLLTAINTPNVVAGESDVINPKITVSDTVKFQHTQPEKLNTVEIYAQTGSVSQIENNGGGTYVGKLDHKPEGNYTIVSVYTEGGVESTTIKY